MMTHRYLIVLFTLLLTLGGCSASTTIEQRQYDAPYLAHAPTIDGIVDDADWEGVPWTTHFVDIQGEHMPTPRFMTRARMAWDDDYFYVAAIMEEPHVWAKLTEHDQIVFYDNDFEVFIDPDGDTEQYYEIEVNALNTIFDLFLVKTYIDGGPALHDWDMRGLRTAIHVHGTLNDPTDTDHGWSVEIAMPWKSLREAAHRPAPPEPGDRWRVNFSRVEWQVDIVDGEYEKVPDTPEDNWVWSPQGAINMHLPQHWGHVTFVK